MNIFNRKFITAEYWKRIRKIMLVLGLLWGLGGSMPVSAAYSFDLPKPVPEQTGRKIHMQSLGGLAHYDFNDAGAHSYEQAAQIIRKMGLSQKDIEQLYRRMVFNELAKNYDDHVKNISFLMDRRGKWKLAPAYDMTFSYNPQSIWTSKHQMMIHSKRELITTEDLIESGRMMDIGDKTIKEVFQTVSCVVKEWTKYAEYVGLCEQDMLLVSSFHRAIEPYKDLSIQLSCLETAKKEKPLAYVEL